MAHEKKNRYRRCGIALLLAGTTLGTAPARAQDADAGGLADLSLESLLDMPVTGASRFVQRRSQASSTVRVITREEMLALGHRTLSEVLQTFSGAAVTTDRTYEYLGVRGFLAAGDYSTRVLLLVDGNRVNDPLYDQAFLGGEFPLDLDAVERVEFVPGQGSAVYGANALFGVVNVITREASRKRHVELGTVVASGLDREVRGALRLPLKNGGLQLMASRQVRQGAPVLDVARIGLDGSDGWADHVDFTRRSALYVRLDHGSFTASLTHADRVRATPMAIDLVYGDPRSQYRDTYSLLNVEATQTVGPQAQVTARAFAGHYRFSGDYLIDYPPVTLNHDDAVTSWRGVEARLRYQGDLGHRIVAGLELQDVPTLLQRNVDLSPVPESYVELNQRSWRAAAYAEDQWALAPGWELDAGLRADRVDRGDWEVSPRFALIWHPARAWSFKLIHGHAFRPPNAFEAYYEVDGPAGYVANPSLTSERVRGTELAVEWRPRGEWRLSASLYRNDAKGLILLGYDDAEDRYAFGNGGRLRMVGGELEAEYARGTLRWRAGYSWVDTTGPGASLSTYPARTFKGMLIWPLRGDWTAALETQLQSARAEAPGHGLLHLTVQGSAWQNGPTLTLAVRNASDRVAYVPGSDPVRQPVVTLPGREWRLEMRWPLPF